MNKFTDTGFRDSMDRDEIRQLQQGGALIVDDRRVRPHYFDGRFLTAHDLTRDQDYFLIRQGDLGRSMGAGVIEGLTVSEGPSATTLIIQAGHGIVASGESVVLTGNVTIDVANVPQTRLLDAAFDADKEPQDPPHNRTGIYILALRPVEYTANLIASYPTQITDPRSSEEGDIIEAVAITLIPFQQGPAMLNAAATRARIAHGVFTRRNELKIPVSTLPLALLSLTANVVDWLDLDLVRRETGVSHRDLLTFTAAPRSLREAQARQYDRQIDELVKESPSSVIKAKNIFQSLPPVGRLPAASINTAKFTQEFFPPTVRVSLSFVPQDELAALIEESLLLPPIDLTLSDEDLASTSVLILAPAARSEITSLRAALQSDSRDLSASLTDAPIAFNPIDAFTVDFSPRVSSTGNNAIDSEWRALLERPEHDGFLWYVRRRNYNPNPSIEGAALPVTGDEFEAEERTDGLLRSVQMVTNFADVRNRATASAGSEMVRLLSSPKFETSKLLLRSAVLSLDKQEKLDRVGVLRVSTTFARPSAGVGLARMEGAKEEFGSSKPLAETLVAADVIHDLDRIAAELPEDGVSGFAEELLAVTKAGDTEEVRAFVANKRLSIKTP